MPPPRKTRFGSPLVLSRVHWVEPELVAEITYLTWTADGLLRHTVYVALRSDKPARELPGNPAHEVAESNCLFGTRRSPLRSNGRGGASPPRVIDLTHLCNGLYCLIPYPASPKRDDSNWTNS